ncbi:MAG TPA: DUF533 domain-containing protein, partial [Hyphomicrobiaceae bacterium]|nr:DUF533 domain-containing protein [Hyphomicrobiaceae bacterium]
QGQQAAPHTGNAQDPAGQLGDLLRQLTQGGQPQSQAGQPGGQSSAPSPVGGLDEMFRNLFPGGGQPSAPAAAPAAPPRDTPRDAPRDERQDERPSTGGGLGDIFGQLQNQATKSGGLGDILGQVFGQATQGVKEGAGKIGQSTGMAEMIEKMSGGRSPEELLEQVKKYISENQLGTGAALGGLGALILGTQTGRSVAASAAKLGALALIGGLAYKAYQNYSQGKPLVDSANATPEPAPAGSGFAQGDVSNDTTLVLIRAMVAAAASDGRLDGAEHQAILGNLQSAGAGSHAEEFMASQLQQPATIDELVASVSTPQEAIKVYTAARIAIDPDTSAEQEFLAVLGTNLGLDQQLMSHIDAQARAAA